MGYWEALFLELFQAYQRIEIHTVKDIPRKVNVASELEAFRFIS